MKSLRPAVAEFIGTFTLIFIGIGAIKSNPGNLLAIAMAHGLAIAVMVCATMHISGGHLNPAVTFGILLAGKMSIGEAIVYWISQLAGATAAAGLCLALFFQEGVNAGTPKLEGILWQHGLVIEAVLTFFLVFVVFGTGVDERGRRVSGLAIGLTVTLDILVGGPLTGAALNPARVFGPALVGNFWENHWIYWVGPMAGGALAAFVYKAFFLREDQV
jgi:MIP family channel proteins